MNTTGCCLVLRGDCSRHWVITTPGPHSPPHDASHLGLDGLVLLNNTLRSLQDLECPFGVKGVSQMISESAILDNNEVTTRETYMKELPQG
jgi:hypothetical protein